MSDEPLWSRLALGQYVALHEIHDWLVKEGFDLATMGELLNRLRERGIVEAHTYPGLTHYPDWRLAVPIAFAIHHATIVDAELRLEHWSDE